ncbi:hypothetical protein EV385_3068 [Krasilnikovia cinnamomea]|uniref:Uncharacterized protein n=1 Tax=Krasilnikovia cinnamomea TaxID=349313 RepID=A0A4Q7ZK18_9ACTN|nr:hypothetical protein [Krasilnikovia cinnamomea]RZU51258.1 hypothetical protein EV385_3068 [Krasilnikovia cinnamomea]
MTETTRPAATAAQRIVAAMWTLDRPATAKQIQEAAGVGYSTVSPVLRRLLAASQAVKSEGGDGSTLWHIVTDIPSTLGPANGDATNAASEPHDPTGGEPPAGDGAMPGISSPTDNARAEVTSDHADSHPDLTGARPALSNPGSEILPTPEGTRPPAAALEADNHPGAAPAEPAEPEPVGSHSGMSDESDPDASATRTTRAYRKPAKPRRPKGALRAAILAALNNNPDRALRVGEMCKIIDGADQDGMFNKAGPGAVVNALDKLVNDGDALRVSEAPASYQFQAKPADADSQR